MPEFTSFDSALGDHHNRYFGDGHKRVRRSIRDLRLDQSSCPGARYCATATLDYPTDWSRKREGELVPHLSSIDTLCLAAALIEAAITHTRCLTPAERDRMWIRSITIVASSTPHEDLSAVKVDATVDSTTDAADVVDGEVESMLTYRVGGLRGTVCVVHAPGVGAFAAPSLTSVPDRIAAPAEILGPSGQSHYLTTFTAHRLDASAICSRGAPDGVITAQTVVSREADLPSVGAEAAYPDSVSLIDAVLGAAQLIQILLYDLDSIDRRDSHTLWMRKLWLETETPLRPSAGDFTAEVAIRRTSVIDRHDARWRSADLELRRFNGITGGSLVAHQLPSTARTAPGLAS